MRGVNWIMGGPGEGVWTWTISGGYRFSYLRLSRRRLPGGWLALPVVNPEGCAASLKCNGHCKCDVGEIGEGWGIGNSPWGR